MARRVDEFDKDMLKKDERILALETDVITLENYLDSAETMIN
jgi:hypothetical protein